MTNTALKNREIKSRENIANRDRELAERQFKHKRTMDYLGLGAKAAGEVAKLFIPGGKAAAAAKGATALVSATKANDPAFYKAYIKDLEKWTNLTTWLRAGTEKYNGRIRGYENISSVDGQIKAKLEVAPAGIAVINWVPVLGAITESLTTVSESPVNQILMRTKEEVLKSNSRSSVPYEAADLGLNFLAVGSIIVAICEFERAILIAQTYKADNAYYAKYMLQATGWDSDAFMSNLTDARKYLLLLKKRFNSAIVAPSGLNYYRKLMFLATMWVKDSEANPAQVYSAATRALFKLNDAGDGLDAVLPVRSAPLAAYNQISNLIQSISENPDYVSMFSDLRSAFAGHLFQLDESFDENATLTEVYDSMAIEQIANISTLPGFIGEDELYVGLPQLETLAIKQTETGYLYQGTAVTNQGAKFRYPTESLGDADGLRYLKTLSTDRDHIINFHKDDISGDDVLDATRWHYTIKEIIFDSDHDAAYVRLDNSDIAVACWVDMYSLQQATLLQSQACTEIFVSQPQYDLPEAMRILHDALCFDWMPLITFVTIETTAISGVKQYWTTVYGEVQHAVNYPVKNISKLNDVCVLSLMYIDSSQFKLSGK